MVTVNGGAETLNPGTTCCGVADLTLSASCTSGYLAIPDNDQELLAALLHAKATGGTVGIYYRDNSTQHHCPGQVFTPCEVMSIMLQ